MRWLILFFWVGVGAEVIDWPRRLEIEHHHYFLEEKGKIIEALGQALTQGSDFDTLYQQACQWRRSIAKQCRQTGYSLFGTSRTGAEDGLFTNTRVARAEHLLEKMRGLVQKGELRNKIFHYSYPYPLFQVFPIYGEIEGKRYLLTEIIGTLPHATHRHRELMVYFGDQEGEILWVHTATEHLSLLLQHAAKLYQEAWNAPDEELLNKIARFHWWFAQLIPCYRGSAAIGEVLVAALWQAKGFYALVQEKTMIDLEALSGPNLEFFISQYPAFYTCIEKIRR